MKKSIYALFLCFCVCLTLCGCGQPVSKQPFETNAFRLVRQTSGTGEIALAYVFPLNSIQLQAQGYTKKQIETYKFYLMTYVNALAQNNRAKQTEGASVCSAQYFTDVDGIGFVISFEDLNAQKKFFGVEDSQSSSAEQKSAGLFMKTTTMTTNFPFSKTSAGDFKMICLMAISSWANDQNLTEDQKKSAQQILDESVFVYDFSTQQTSLKSDLMYDDENFHHNVFVKTQAQLENDNQITFWTSIPNYPIWYASALVIVVLGMTVAFMWVKIKRKTREKA